MSRIGLIALSALLSSANGFITPSPNGAIARKELIKVNNVGDPTGFDSFQDAKDVAELKNMPVGEAQRSFRRTVYTHDDWRKHRSSDRFFLYILSIFKNGVYENLGREIGAVTAISTFVVIYNALAGGYTDITGVEHAGLLPFDKLGIPMGAFTLTSPSLGLLLGRYILISFVLFLEKLYISSKCVQFFVPIHPTNDGTKLVKTGV
jgi:hypothetical protein